MIPDPEQEQRWQAHIAARFGDAPEPDPRRLATALAGARGRARHARFIRRCTAWATAGLLAATAAATTGWWALSGEPVSRIRGGSTAATPAPGESGEQPFANGDAGENEAGQNEAGTAAGAADPPRKEQATGAGDRRETPLIYRRAQ